VGDDQRPVSAVQHLFEHHDLAGALEAECIDDVECVVKQDLLPPA
jgi:hypothetical protein